MFYLFLTILITISIFIFINKNNFFKILICYECLTLFSILVFSNLILSDYQNVVMIILTILVVSTVDVVIGITFIIYFSQNNRV
jgi:hypothetical protein